MDNLIVVSTCLLLQKGKFFSYIGLDGYMLSSLTCGMSPIVSIMEAVQQVINLSYHYHPFN